MPSTAIRSVLNLGLEIGRNLEGQQINHAGMILLVLCLKRLGNGIC